MRRRRFVAFLTRLLAVGRPLEGASRTVIVPQAVDPTTPDPRP